MSDSVVVFMGTYLALLMIVALGVYGFSSQKVRWLEYGASILGALALAYTLGRIAGLFYYHEQPFAVLQFTPLIPHEIDNAFPSDHALVAGVLAGIASLYNRGLGVLLWMLAVGVGAGRVMAGVHYPLDIVVGLVIGGLCAMVAHRIVHLYFRALAHTK